MEGWHIRGRLLWGARLAGQRKAARGHSGLTTNAKEVSGKDSDGGRRTRQHSTQERGGFGSAAGVNNVNADDPRREREPRRGRGGLEGLFLHRTVLKRKKRVGGSPAQLSVVVLKTLDGPKAKLSNKTDPVNCLFVAVF